MLWVINKNLGFLEIQRLNNIGSKRLVVQVSLDGASNRTNDRVRGKGSFKKAFSLMPKQSSIRRIREFKPQSKEDDISISTLYSPRDPQLKIVLDTIREMGLISGVVSEDELIKTLMDEHEIKNDEARKLIITLMREGDIYSPKPGYYKKTL